MTSSKIFVVDGSLLGRKRISTLLEAAGHQVVECDSARQVMQALPDLPRGTVSVLVTELDLPDLEGLAFLRWLKHTALVADIPVVVVTADVDRERIVEVIQAGAETMIARPFASDVFLRRITEVLAVQPAPPADRPGALSWNLEDYLRRELKRSVRCNHPLSLVLGSLPASSHPHADLEAIMSQVARIVRESDAIACLQPNQFAVVLPDTDQLGAAVVEAKVQRVAGQGTPPLAVHTGAATSPTDGLEPGVLIELARRRCGGEVRKAL